ncbi:MAG: flagellar export chaperone FlgN [Phycisphaerales bacterium]|nr:flagellar export chaperone FlgN [Phycisphaerales bacterium]
MSGHVTMNAGAELSKLAEILAEMIREHQKWLVLIEQHRDAVRHADPRAVERSLDAQRHLMANLAAIEQTRQDTVRALWKRFGPDAAGAMNAPLPKLGRLLDVLPTPHRHTLQVQAQELRRLIERVRYEESSLKAATAALSAHIEGLMRHVGRRLSHAGTYGRRGVVEATPALAAAVDLVR